MSTKKQKQERLAADIATRLGSTFSVTVEDKQVWVEYSAVAGQGPFARARVPLNHRDWRTATPLVVPFALAEAARDGFGSQHRDSRFTEDAKALALQAYLAAGAPDGVDVSEDAFEEYYRPVAGPSANGDPVQSFEQVRSRPVEHVWTLTECDGDICAAPGFHVVNNVGYVVTEVPWPREDLCAAWDVRDDEDDPDDEAA